MFLYIHNCFSVLTFCGALFLLTLTSIIHLIAHECGHLIGGALSGYKLLMIQVGPLSIEKNVKRISFHAKKTFGNQCIMIPSLKKDIKIVPFNMGGIIANAIITIIGFFGILLNKQFFVELLLFQLFLVGANKIILNAVPRISNAIPNDGYITRILLKYPLARKDYAIYLNLYAAQYRGEKIDKENYSYKRESETSEGIELIFYNEINNLLQYIN